MWEHRIMNNKNVILSNKNSHILNIDSSVRKEIFSGTFEDAQIKDNEYCQLALYGEKFFTITYLSELFYGKKAITSGL